MSILNFGSLNIDYVYGVEEFVRAGQTITSRDLEVFPGGKGLNQSLALSRAGAQVCHAGLIGPDGFFLRSLLEESGVDVTWVRSSDHVRSGNAIIQKNAKGDNCIILYSGANRAIGKDYVDQVLDHYGPGDWLLLQNETSQLSTMITKAKERGMTIILNPSPADDKLLDVDLDAIDCFVLNGGEAAILVGSDGDGQELAQAMHKRFPRARIVLTLGEKGSIMIQEGRLISQEAYRVPTVDTTAAGDTFTGYLLAGLMQGGPAEEALDLAARASAMAVSKSGAAPSIPLIEDVRRFEVPEPGSDPKMTMQMAATTSKE
ncbi:ribokinase [Bifidobacterium aemilianum]|uniref:Ribokinase n=1 Tax=Bifidobacterium aemilianum TaxID=2493120 RepID=A0A366K9S3_9BIFI|nr:ribokinase [Bifidobacterium aemilianum]RBP97918.1 ribokinase [Bifidobacterium aemilianum]